MHDICIIGAGASGLTAAVSAARAGAGKDITVIEKNSSAGRKVLATGAGRCNLTNAQADGMKEVLAFFSSIGIAVKSTEEGLFYPMSERAEDVVRALEGEAGSAGVSFILGAEVTGVRHEDAFEIDLGGSVIRAEKLIIAAGGKAAPQYGTTGDSYRFARSLGHSVNKVFPVLTGLKTADAVRSLKGVRVRAGCTLKRDGAAAAEEHGEVQFGEGYVSGICVMNLSRELKYGQGMREKYELVLDLLPGMDEERVKAALMHRSGILWMKSGDILNSIIPSKLASEVIRRAGIDPEIPAADISESEISAAAHCLKGFTLSVSGAQGWKNAQCTAGGVPKEEIDPDTMESRIIPGLYFTGEALDYAGPCGGFNLNNAWLTGLKAGRAAAK
ncbi:MAG: aminoacetone oxidase family FAD-binding enzyme [Anaerovoracaceae bacterium]|jgi:predicted Rossmann fold flavoprotein